MKFTKKELASFVTHKLQIMGYQMEILFMDYSGYEPFSDIKWGKRGAYLLREAYASDKVIAKTKNELLLFLDDMIECHIENLKLLEGL